MSIPTTAANPWPERAAWLSATIFIGASGATNVLYGWQKGTDLPTSLVWAGVAGAVAVIFALAWPALIRSIEGRRWSAALVSLLALVLAGSYSVTAALGSASGGRANAATQETAVADVRTKAQAAYDVAKAELATVKPARPVAELEAMRAGWLRAYPRQPWVLEPELARSKRRAELEARIEREATKLASTGPARVANSDAKSLARYMAAIGFEITADRLNDLLVLLAVIMIEAGGGLSLAIGMALSGPSRTPTAASASSVSAQPRTAPAALSEALPPPTRTDRPMLAGSLRPIEVEILDLLAVAGGKAEGVRRLAAKIGRPRSTVSDECRRLAAAGLITMNRGRHGTLLTLVPASQHN